MSSPEHMGRKKPKTAAITNIQRFSLHDGGGIRTVIFFKGCPFRCPWCCNPENLSFEDEIIYKKRLCIHCSDRSDKTLDANGCPCNTKPKNCPTGAKSWSTTHYTIDELVDISMRDSVFYEESGGGVTVSGGECLARHVTQIFIMELFERLHSHGIHTAIETTLAIDLLDSKRLAQVCNTFLVDFKIAGPHLSRTLLGIDTNLRNANCRELIALGATIVGRMPIIPGYTDSEENVYTNCETQRNLAILRTDILPFHQLGMTKYASVGRSYEMEAVTQLDAADLTYVQHIAEQQGLLVKLHGE
ncbi:glycyl-radical enzyme activating protein [Collinsella sp. zg1085]|uniref:glycyl-radical enzyme activating protein n=1 Tax=Collinsella sp. zg1085 TaxID=2844380 RepID=UPI001C0E2754|nr:glycyl-radical enzyme activating protein [Collinsella sp. zg1085]QWT18015.1 glycyl-radical enzyme activating protein [Collinsella sp. zg1085]